jgi:formylglycine-generating enzyme required for sulfatase activity
LLIPLLLLGGWALFAGGDNGENEAVIAPLPTETAVPSLTPTATWDPNLPPPNPEAGDIWTRPADGMEMVYVPAGTFLMGSDPEEDPEADNDEFPQHGVTLDGFWMDRTEVTNAMYEECVADGDCSPSALSDDADYNGPEQPVVGVSWNDAEAYCEWAGGQLPTEAQWEYAAREEDGRLYPWGDESPTCDLAQFGGCSGRTVPVGSFSPEGDSPFGLADMAGNVWEWTGSAYEPYPYDPDDGRESISGTDVRPVLRGGSWFNGDFSVRAANRFDFVPANRNYFVGFRCAQE